MHRKIRFFLLFVFLLFGLLAVNVFIKLNGGCQFIFLNQSGTDVDKISLVVGSIVIDQVDTYNSLRCRITHHKING